MYTIQLWHQTEKEKSKWFVINSWKTILHNQNIKIFQNNINIASKATCYETIEIHCFEFLSRLKANERKQKPTPYSIIHLQLIWHIKSSSKLVDPVVWKYMHKLQWTWADNICIDIYCYTAKPNFACIKFIMSLYS